MYIPCSACDAPLPQGAKFCPADALPLTAIAIAMIDAEIWNSPDKLQNRIAVVSLSTDPAKGTIARLQTRVKALQHKGAQ
jgi:predicted amidophosphoribosyltransferase